MKKQAILICQFMLLAIYPVLAQTSYRITYTLRGKMTGQSVLVCSAKQSLYADLPATTSEKNAGARNETIAEAMKRVDADTPTALNKKIVTLHTIGTGKVVYAEDETPYKYTVEDGIPTNWHIAEESRKIGNYTCQKAITQYKGRTIIAWFTKEIPYSAGPWKLAGLPGLILEAASTDDHYQFLFASCTPITPTPEQLTAILANPKLSYQQYLQKHRAYYQNQANKIYKETSSGFLQRFGIIKVSPIKMNVENIDKNLERRFVSNLK